jgi:hypothetical protein
MAEQIESYRQNDTDNDRSGNGKIERKILSFHNYIAGKPAEQGNLIEGKQNNPDNDEGGSGYYQQSAEIIEIHSRSFCMPPFFLRLR